MRIRFNNQRRPSIIEVDCVEETSDGMGIIIPKLRKLFHTGDQTEEILQTILEHGFADMTAFSAERHVSEVLL